MELQPYQRRFIEFAIEHNVLRFGQFTLKSGRQSPYFFNAGLFNTGKLLAELGRFYAQAIVARGVEFDVLFGPAYKGIPIASATAVALYDQYGIDVPWCFNRKEAKAHGEGGALVGAQLQGRVLIIDDVITAGTAIREVMAILQAAGAKPAGVVVAVDRQERGQGELSAIQEVERDFDIPVLSVVNLGHIVSYLQSDPGCSPEITGYLQAVQSYRDQYGIS